MIIIDLLALWIAASLGYACLMIIKPLPAERSPLTRTWSTDLKDRRRA